MFSTYSIPKHHPLHRLPLRTQSLVYAFVRPQLPSNLRQQLTRVSHNGIQLTEWLVKKICNDLATDFRSPVLYGTPFAKFSPYVYKEWLSNAYVQIRPQFVHQFSINNSDTVATWLIVRFALPRIWDTIIHTIEDENTVGYFGVVRHCQLIEREGDIVLQIHVEQ